LFRDVINHHPPARITIAVTQMVRMTVQMTFVRPSLMLERLHEGTVHHGRDGTDGRDERKT
jgi:hypothetical protein